jgi:hypothetical protein
MAADKGKRPPIIRPPITLKINYDTQRYTYCRSENIARLPTWTPRTKPECPFFWKHFSRTPFFFFSPYLCSTILASRHRVRTKQALVFQLAVKHRTLKSVVYIPEVACVSASAVPPRHLFPSPTPQKVGSRGNGRNVSQLRPEKPCVDAMRVARFCLTLWDPESQELGSHHTDGRLISETFLDMHDFIDYTFSFHLGLWWEDKTNWAQTGIGKGSEFRAKRDLTKVSRRDGYRT